MTFFVDITLDAPGSGVVNVAGTVHAESGNTATQSHYSSSFVRDATHAQSTGPLSAGAICEIADHAVKSVIAGEDLMSGVAHIRWAIQSVKVIKGSTEHVVYDRGGQPR